MLHRNAFYLVLILFVSMQVNVHGGIWTEITRKITELLNNNNVDKKPNGPVSEDCNLCVWGSCAPSVQPLQASEFHASVDADTLITALSSISGDRDPITNILTSRSEAQRNMIGENFKTKKKVGLANIIQSKLDDTYTHTKLMVALATPMPEFYAIQFKRAIESQKDEIKGNEGRIAMLEMFTTLSPCLIRKIIAAYNMRNGPDSFVTDIERSLKKFPQSNYIDVFKTLAQGNRDDNVNTYWLKALVDAWKMKKAIETQNWKMGKEVFQEVFTKRSIPQLKEIVTVYENLRKGANGFSSLDDDINNHMEKVKEIYATIVKIVKNQPLYFASMIKIILEKTPTVEEESKLANLIRGRCDIDLGDIRKAYDERYPRSLLRAFKDWQKSNRNFNTAVCKIIE